MMNYECDFSQSESEKYVDWIKIFLNQFEKKKTTKIENMETHFALQHQPQAFLYEDQLGAGAQTPNWKKKHC